MQRTFFRVTFFAMLVLLVETVLFNVLMYIQDFFFATAVIGFAVLGVGLGAFAASKVRMEESLLFLVCCIGTTVCLYGASLLLVRYPVVGAVVGAVAASVFFPVLYIGVLFRENPGGRAYLFDMAGAGAGVVATVALYEVLTSEGIVLLIAGALPLVGLAGYVFRNGQSKRRRTVAALVGVPLAALGLSMFVVHLALDTFNIYRIFDRDAPYELDKMLQDPMPDKLVATYDSLVGRIDVMELGHKEKGRKSVYYNGWPNDHFIPGRYTAHASFDKRGIEWPSHDLRVFYGLKEHPSIFIIGAAARGITHTAKRITPAEKIHAVEINPGIVEIMQDDFYEESGRAYEGLHTITGNALSHLKALDRKFDAITLINTHSGRTIGYRAGPDYLHTLEHYQLYLDHLSDDGFILFEERPYNRSGELGLYRMLLTMWSALAARGAEDPSRHFFIWEWVSGPVKREMTKDYDAAKGRYRLGEKWYVGMIVTKSPLVGERQQKALSWFFEAAGAPGRAVYLKDVAEHGEVADVFGMIEAGDFSRLAADDFDATVVTNDRPFASLSTNGQPELASLLKWSMLLTAALTVLFLVGAFIRARPGQVAFLGGFNIVIGFGYFFIEVMLIQIYQNVFVSPAWSLVLVLGILLLCSGIGGHFGRRLKSWQATALLMPVAVAAIYLPSLLLDWGVPSWLGKGASVALIGATGFLLGVFFPRGLELADHWGLKRKVPIMFAINSAAGSTAVLVALYSGIRLGYQATVILAVLFYCVAGVMLIAATRGKTAA